ncbi:MAG: cbb3-type cytochrome oxidase assembly protein CcoS [Paracoccus denitrificans]|uniref:Cbb3-type cytochrome oxidase assembly protein CcoS n=1 Tax=Paracoccus denitrificans TaxID=266 RepID=A0A533I9E1_PARDE|nr:MAG: cbb3-type cytochrome oxidase assembly protein CcoS [Paracoccus denitrificans]
MDVLFILIPVSILLGAGGLGAFLWSLKSRQYDDPKGDAERVLSSEWDDHPKPPVSDQKSDP